jgi:hypothetical protein
LTIERHPSSVKQILDTISTASGELMFNIFSSLAQFERRLIQERTKAGRKPISSDDPRVKTAKRMHKDHGMEINQICMLSTSHPTFYRYLVISDEKSHQRTFSFQ